MWRSLKKGSQTSFYRFFQVGLKPPICMLAASRGPLLPARCLASLSQSPLSKVDCCLPDFLCPSLVCLLHYHTSQFVVTCLRVCLPSLNVSCGKWRERWLSCSLFFVLPAPLEGMDVCRSNRKVLEHTVCHINI